jgi:hypothetical protein
MFSVTMDWFNKVSKVFPRCFEGRGNRFLGKKQKIMFLWPPQWLNFKDEQTMHHFFSCSQSIGYMWH